MTENTKPTAITIRFSPDVYEKIVELAKRQKRSLNAQASFLIEQALECAEQPPTPAPAQGR